MSRWGGLREALRGGAAGDETCFGCVSFVNAPAEIEAAIPGLTTFSSGHASVRADDGLCRKHGVYLNGRRACADRQARC